MSRTQGLALLALAGACVDPAPSRDYGDPSASQSASEQAGIVAQVLSPSASTPVATSLVEVVLSAYTRGAALPLTVTVTAPDAPAVTATAMGAPGESQRFRASVRLVHGANPWFRVSASHGARRPPLPEGKATRPVRAAPLHWRAA